MKTWEWMCKFSGEVSPLRYLQVNRKHLGISHVPSNAMDHSLQVDLQCLRGGKGLPDPARVALKKPTNGPTNRQPSENLKRCSITIFLLEYPCRCAKQKPWFLSKKKHGKRPLPGRPLWPQERGRRPWRGEFSSWEQATVMQSHIKMSQTQHVTLLSNAVQRGLLIDHWQVSFKWIR